MYLNIDLASPRIASYLLNTKAKNRILRYWTQTNIGGEQVFDRLYLYAYKTVVEFEPHLKLYQLFGIDIDELKAEDYDGVDKLWLYFKYTNYLSPSDIADQQLYDYVKDVCNDDVTYKVTLNYVQQGIKSSPVLAGVDTTNYILDLFAQPFDGSKLKILNTGSNPASFVALNDIDQTLFDTTVRVGATKISESKTRDPLGVAVGFTYTTTVEFTFKEKQGVTVTDCDALFSRVRASAYIPTNFYSYVSPIDPAGEWVSNTVEYDPTLETDGYPEDGGNINTILLPTERYLKVSTFENMTSREVGEFLKKAIDSDYSEVKASFWEQLLNVVIIIIAVVVTIMSGGSAGAAAVGLVNTVGAFATVAATVLAVTMVVQFALAYAMKSLGNYSGAILFGKSMVIVGKVLKIVGILALFAGIMKILTEGFTTAITNAAGQEIGRQALSFSDIGLKILSWLNKGYGVYTDYTNEKQEEQEKTAAEAKDAEEEAEMIARTPQAMELMKENFESYYFLDANEQMDNVPYELTEGRIEASTTKYYS